MQLQKPPDGGIVHLQMTRGREGSKECGKEVKLFTSVLPFSNNREVGGTKEVTDIFYVADYLTPYRDALQLEYPEELESPPQSVTPGFGNDSKEMMR
ncbi:hypothetical protein AVEN_138418-1 [Araneus ventricosus]|uniref:Uncharacterized protein n=1 Tax=Araneus ventricosus TaxID=182803 RepID=A0A4Y2PAI8_ARAVE|nr:hypothetical protein AVEN_138418-1 [Araneus ventricosus]